VAESGYREAGHRGPSSCRILHLAHPAIIEGSGIALAECWNEPQVGGGAKDKIGGRLTGLIYYSSLNNYRSAGRPGFASTGGPRTSGTARAVRCRGAGFAADRGSDPGGAAGCGRMLTGAGGRSQRTITLRIRDLQVLLQLVDKLDQYD